MGSRIEGSRGSRKGCPNHPLELKMRLAQAAAEPNVSVAKLAREHGINANLLFKWRRQYLAGALGARSLPATQPSGLALLAVNVEEAAAVAPAASSAPAVSGAQAPSEGEGCLEIELCGATLRCFGRVDPTLLGQVMSILRGRA